MAKPVGAHVKGIIFDLDGTLLDTLADLAHAANKTLADCGYPTHDIEAYRLFVGHGIEELMRRALPENQRTEAHVADALTRFQAIYTTTWNVDSAPYPGIPAMLNRLADLGLPMAVYTNKPQHLAESCITEFFSSWPLTPVIGQRQGLPVKPDPCGARDILDGWQLNAEEVIMMGDSGVDMRTALNTGLIAVGVRWGFRTEEELIQNGARILLRHPNELFNYIEAG